MDQVVNSSLIGNPLLLPHQSHKSHPLHQQILTFLLQRLSQVGVKSANAKARRKIEQLLMRLL